MTVYTVPDLLRQAGLADLPLIVDGDERLTRAEVLSRAERLAAALSAQGVRRGDRVAILQPRSAKAVVSFFATHLAGGVAVFVNEKLRAPQINHILRSAEPAALIADADLLDRYPGLELGAVKVVDPSASAEGAPRAGIIGNDLALIIYTSGSSGLPKGIMVSHANLIAGAEIVADYLGITAADRILSLLPFSFDYGLNQLLTACATGATLVIQRSMFPADICNALAQHEITGMAGVPMLWSQLAESYSPFLERSFPKLRYMTNSGGVFPAKLIPRFREAHPQAQLFLMYGLTEAFRSTYLPPDELPRRPGSIGRAIPNCEILVVDDEGRECPPGQPGELVHRGPTVALGYWKDPEASARAFRQHPGGLRETVVFSGDLVRRDEDGFLHYLGRKDKMFKSCGIRTSSEEIEHYLLSSGVVTHAVVFPRAKSEVEIEIVAVVVPKDATIADAEVIERLKDHARREMPEYLRPALLHVTRELPETTSGKPDRPKIEELYRGR